jgi:hypothetical protein
MSSGHFTDVFRSLALAINADEKGCESAFATMASFLFERVVLDVAGVAWSLAELEFYVHGRGHCDPYVHDDPLQHTFGRWYFHRRGAGYRGGSYKGLDLTFGDRDLAAGILLRGLVHDDGARYLDGPCVLVDHLLACTGAPSVAALAAHVGDRAVCDPRSPLVVRVRELPRRVTVYASPRVGLTLRRGDTLPWRRALAKEARFLTEPRRIRKGRPQLVVGLYRRGVAPVAIAAHTGMRLAVVERYVDAYRAGREGRRMLSLDDPSPEAVCARLGHCERS